MLEKHKAQWNYLYPSEKEVLVWSVLTRVPSLGPGSGPSPFRFCAGGFVRWQHDCQGFPAFPLSDLAKEEHKDEADPCASALIPAGGWAVELLPPPPAQKCHPDLTQVLSLSLKAAQCEDHCSDGRMAFCNGKDWARGALHSEQIYMPNFPGFFSLDLSSFLWQIRSRAELSCRLLECPQLEPAQWEDGVLAVSERKALASHWEFQEWEFFSFYLYSYCYICLLFKQEWCIAAIP